MCDDEFRPVTRKKWLARRDIQPRVRKISDKCYNSESAPVDVEKFVIRLEKACEHMIESDYFVAAAKTLDNILKNKKDKQNHDSNESQAENELKELKHLICFGIGPFTRSFQAFHQLAFIISLQRHYRISNSLYFDPIFQICEKDILNRLNCEVMSKNCEAKYEVKELTLFYMPHCPNALTNNLLWCNWRPTLLKNAILINNSFESLCSNKPERLLKMDSNYLLNILPYVREYPLDDDYEARNVFNDLSVHVFLLENLPAEASDFWEVQAAPVYNDVELIKAEEEFAKLAIS